MKHGIFIVSLLVPILLAVPLHATLPKVRISIVLHGDDLRDVTTSKAGDHLDLRYTDALPGKTSILSNLREYPYPVNFDPAKMSNFVINGNATKLAIPITPTEFITEDVGWSIDLNPDIVQGLIRLSATSTYTSVSSHISSSVNKGVYGENTRPIYGEVKDAKTGKISHELLCANATSMPSFEKSVTPFVLFAKPGKEYAVKLQRGEGWVDATIKCELL